MCELEELKISALGDTTKNDLMFKYKYKLEVLLLFNNMTN